MVDQYLLGKMGEKPTSRIDHVPCICDVCHTKYETSVLHDSLESCPSWSCFQKVIDKQRKASKEFIEKWNNRVCATGS